MESARSDIPKAKIRTKWKGIIFSLTSPVMRWIFRWSYHVLGQQNYHDGSAILCSNHTSHLDFYTVVTIGGGASKNYVALAAEDYWFASKIKGFLPKIGINLIKNSFNLIPIVRRSSRTRNAFEEMISRCRSRQTDDTKFIIFPEGGRASLEHGMFPEVRKFRPGVARMSMKLDLPVIPLYLGGTGFMLNKERKTKWRDLWKRQFFCAVGDPIFPKDYEQNREGEMQMTKDIEQKVSELRESLLT